MNISRQAVSDNYLQTLASSVAAVFKMTFNPAVLLLGVGISLYGAVYDKYIICGFAILTILILHVVSSKLPLVEICVIIMTGVIGACVETINVMMAVYQYGTPTFQDALLPTWVVTIWFVIGAAIRHTFHWLSRHLLISSMMGALLGGLIYFAGSKLGVIQFRGDSNRFLVLAILLWALAFPLLTTIGHQMFPDHTVD
ncbi:DUF2878 domain-containing protein [Kaarinaea lacus]